MLGLLSDKVSIFHYPLLLIDYIRTERYGQWGKHLSAVTQMLPFILMMDHQFSAQWCSVYVVDMNRVKQSSAETLNTCCQSIRKTIFCCMVRYDIEVVSQLSQ